MITFRLRLTLKQVILSYSFFGLKFNHSKASSISEIIKINLIEKCQFTNTSNKQQIATVKADFLIQTEKRKYHLRNLSQQEAKWIAEQIGQRLNMPISVVKVEDKSN